MYFILNLILGRKLKVFQVSEMRNLTLVSSVAHVEERIYCGMVVHTMVVEQSSR